MDLIIPIKRKDPFDDPAYLFELKLDGFRARADTVNGRMLSKNGNRMRRFSGDYIANGQRGADRTEKHVKHESM